jgi:hypothetical protein
MIPTSWHRATRARARNETRNPLTSDHAFSVATSGWVARWRIRSAERVQRVAS